MFRPILVASAVFLLISTAESVSWAQKCCVKSFDAPLNEKDISTADSIGKHFEVDAEFKPDAPCRCGCCEYRQEIKGGAYTDGNKVTITLIWFETLQGPVAPGQPQPVARREKELSETEYGEDCRDYGDGVARRYGHRNEAKTFTENYTKGGTGSDSASEDRVSGCKYHMTDEPQIRNAEKGHTYKLTFTFRGTIIAVRPCELCDGCTSKEWTETAEKKF